ncbi:hypothetical protein NUSPORA_02589 [Nucleospora cyclopteri]
MKAITVAKHLTTYALTQLGDQKFLLIPLISEVVVGLGIVRLAINQIYGGYIVLKSQDQSSNTNDSSSTISDFDDVLPENQNNWNELPTEFRKFVGFIICSIVAYMGILILRHIWDFTKNIIMTKEEDETTKTNKLVKLMISIQCLLTGFIMCFMIINTVCDTKKTCILLFSVLLNMSGYFINGYNNTKENVENQRTLNFGIFLINLLIFKFYLSNELFHLLVKFVVGEVLYILISKSKKELMESHFSTEITNWGHILLYQTHFNLLLMISIGLTSDVFAKYKIIQETMAEFLMGVISKKITENFVKILMKVPGIFN